MWVRVRKGRWREVLIIGGMVIINKIKSMSKRNGWEYGVFLSPRYNPEDLDGNSEDGFSRDMKLDFRPDYGINQQKELPVTFNQSPNSLRHTPLSILNQQNHFSKFDDFPLSALSARIPINQRIESHIIDKKLQFSDHQSDQENTPLKEPDHHPLFTGNSLFRIHEQKERIEEESFDLNNKKKSRAKEKGLRNLAGKSYQIMMELGSATYKQVAMRLLDEMERSQSGHSIDKEESNIKRRVYDALNVLIALDVLKKNRKMIIYDPTHGAASSSAEILRKKQFIENFEDQIAECRDSITEKRIKLRSLKEKRDKFQRLFARNQSHEDKKSLKTIPLIHAAVQVDNFEESDLSRDKDEEGNEQVRLQVRNEEYNILGEFDSMIFYLKI